MRGAIGLSTLHHDADATRREELDYVVRRLSQLAVTTMRHSRGELVYRTELRARGTPREVVRHVCYPPCVRRFVTSRA